MSPEIAQARPIRKSARQQLGAPRDSDMTVRRPPVVGCSNGDAGYTPQRHFLGTFVAQPPAPRAKELKGFNMVLALAQTIKGKKANLE
jgi:hypothetical protein